MNSRQSKRFGDAIRAKRIANGWSQAQLVKRMDEVAEFGYIDTSIVSRIETANRTVSVEQAASLAAVLGLSLDECFGLPQGTAERQREARSALAAEISARSSELQQLLRRL